MSQSDFDKQAERENREKEFLAAIKKIANALNTIREWCEANWKVG